MPTSSLASSDSARKSLQLILQRLASVGQEPVANSVGVSISTISRWQSEDLQRCAAIIDALGLKVVGKDLKCYDSRTLDAMVTLARQRMDQIKGSDQLVWDEDVA